MYCWLVLIYVVIIVVGEKLMVRAVSFILSRMSLFEEASRDETKKKEIYEKRRKELEYFLKQFLYRFILTLVIQTAYTEMVLYYSTKDYVYSFRHEIQLRRQSECYFKQVQIIFLFIFYFITHFYMKDYEPDIAFVTGTFFL